MEMGGYQRIIFLWLVDGNSFCLFRLPESVSLAHQRNVCLKVNGILLWKRILFDLCINLIRRSSPVFMTISANLRCKELYVIVVASLACSQVFGPRRAKHQPCTVAQLTKCHKLDFIATYSEWIHPVFELLRWNVTRSGLTYNRRRSLVWRPTVIRKIPAKNHITKLIN